MAWNDNKNNSWGDGQTPPELDEVIKEFKGKFGNLFGNDKSDSKSKKTIKPPSAIFKYIFILVLLIWISSGIYIISPAEKGVVLRFGAFQEETSQGPHWHIPYPIENVYVVNVSDVQKVEIGFRETDNQSRKLTRKILSESLMLTKDGNIVDVSFQIQYNINSAKNYLFNVYNPKQTLVQISNSVIREVVGKHNMDYVITDGRTDITNTVKEKAQNLLNAYQTGLYISSVNYISSQVPEQVQAAYSDVTKAKTDKKRYINQAESYANDILPKARGKSSRIIAEADAYKSQVTSKSEGESDRFIRILAEYEKSPKVTKERLYRETMESVLSKTGKVIVDSKANSMIYLPIDKLLNKKEPNTEIIIQKTQPKQGEQKNGFREVFRSRGVR